MSDLPAPVNWIPLLAMSLTVGVFESVFFRGSCKAGQAWTRRLRQHLRGLDGSVQPLIERERHVFLPRQFGSHATARRIRAACSVVADCRKMNERDVRYAPGIFSTIRPASSPKSKTSIFGGSTPSVVSAVQI